MVEPKTMVYDCNGDYIETPTEDFDLFEYRLEELCRDYGLTPVSWDGEVGIGFIGGYYNGGSLIEE